MAVIQLVKNKVLPVLNFCELNDHVSCHMGGEPADVCGETFQVWKPMTRATTIVDLKSACLQFYVSEKLWKYQLMRYKNRTYCWTWLGFGLNSAMKVVAKMILGKGAKMEEAIILCINDIHVDEGIVTAEEIMDHLKKFRLTAKLPEATKGGAMLEFKIERVKMGKLIFHWGNEILGLSKDMSR